MFEEPTTISQYSFSFKSLQDLEIMPDKHLADVMGQIVKVCPMQVITSRSREQIKRRWITIRDEAKRYSFPFFHFFFNCFIFTNNSYKLMVYFLFLVAAEDRISLERHGRFFLPTI